MNKKWLAGPYLVWMVGFIVIPLLLIVYYGLTDKSGAFTLANVLSISTPEHHFRRKRRASLPDGHSCGLRASRNIH